MNLLEVKFCLEPEFVRNQSTVCTNMSLEKLEKGDFEELEF